MAATAPYASTLAADAARVTELAAIASYAQIGRGDEKQADQLAVDAMRTALNALDIDGKIVIGEGERDEAPMLYIGEKVGTGKGPAIDIALDPLEGTTLTAKAMANALCVLSMSPGGGMLHAPDTYMDKIAIGPGFAPGTVDLDMKPQDNVRSLASAKGVKPEDITVCVMDRPRHAELIAALREVGARVLLITDGDVAGVIHTAEPETGIDLYLDEVHVAVKGGRNPAYREEDGQRVMKQSEITVRVRLGRGDAVDTVWTCDFSHEYVTINADYRS